MLAGSSISSCRSVVGQLLRLPSTSSAATCCRAVGPTERVRAVVRPGPTLRCRFHTARAPSSPARVPTIADTTITMRYSGETPRDNATHSVVGRFSTRAGPNPVGLPTRFLGHQAGHGVDVGSPRLLVGDIDPQALAASALEVTAWSSPRWTRCNTVWRATPNATAATSSGSQPSGAVGTIRSGRPG